LAYKLRSFLHDIEQIFYDHLQRFRHFGVKGDDSSERQNAFKAVRELENKIVVFLLLFQKLIII
jgi:hypothetical protein